MLLDEQFYRLGWRVIEFDNKHIAYTKIISPTAYQIITSNYSLNIPRSPSQPIIIYTFNSETKKLLSFQMFKTARSFLDNMQSVNLPTTTKMEVL